MKIKYIEDESIRELAILRSKPYFEDLEYTREEYLELTLFGAFIWQHTPEGHQYWFDVYNKIKNEK